MSGSETESPCEGSVIVEPGSPKGWQLPEVCHPYVPPLPEKPQPLTPAFILATSVQESVSEPGQGSGRPAVCGMISSVSQHPGSTPYPPAQWNLLL